MLASDVQKKHFNKLKHDLEGWREVIVHSSGVLKWEKNFYPGITCGAVTFLYLVLWWMDLSVLTTVALIALTICAGDFALPLLLKFVFKPENWTGAQEKKYDQCCVEIYNSKVQLCNLWIRFCNAKEQKSTMVSGIEWNSCVSSESEINLEFRFQFVILVSIALLLLAWIGSTMNNMFLCYLLTLAVVNYPGLCSYGVVDKLKELLGGHLKTLVGMISGISGGGGGGSKKDD